MACANVANLLLARAEGRQREISVRAAIGAGKARLIRQLLTESFVLAASGGLLGVALAWAGVRIIAAGGAAGLPALAPLGLDKSLLGFALVLAAVTTVLFGFAPAVQALRLNLAASLKDTAANTSAGLRRQGIRGALAAVQMALAVVLLLGAGLMLRSLAALMAVDLGFEPRHVLTLQVRPPEAAYPKPEAVVAFDRALLERVRALPGVQAAGLVRSLPLAAEIGDWGLAARGLRRAAGTAREGRLAGRLRRRARGARRAAPARTSDPRVRHGGRPAGRARQRDARAHVLARRGPDRQAPAHGRAWAIAPGCGSSVCCATSATTA